MYTHTQFTPPNRGNTRSMLIRPQPKYTTYGRLSHGCMCSTVPSSGESGLIYSSVWMLSLECVVECRNDCFRSTKYFIPLSWHNSSTTNSQLMMAIQQWTTFYLSCNHSKIFAAINIKKNTCAMITSANNISTYTHVVRHAYFSVIT